MTDSGHKEPGRLTLTGILLNRNYWMLHFLFVTVVSIAGLIYIGRTTYTAAPPLESFASVRGDTVITKDAINNGQNIFLRRGLMTYGSFWGDGAERGPDFTADALHLKTRAMREFYARETANDPAYPYRIDAVAQRVKKELHRNGWDKQNDRIIINDAQIYAFTALKEHYNRVFRDPAYPSYIRLGHHLPDEDIADLSSFLFWGAWVTAANRPGELYSYTHNWPYDPDAGNLPTTDTYFWSAASILVLFLGIMLVLYAYGQMKVIFPEPFGIKDDTEKLLTTTALEEKHILPTQRSTYKFFVLAMILFGLQITAGIVCALDFVRPYGIFLGDILPFSVARSYHTLLQIFWFFMCWVGYTVFFLPGLAGIPKKQRLLIDVMFSMCVFVACGALVGIYLGQTGRITGDTAYWLGSQGWEYMELGRLFQIILLAAFMLWIFIIYRAVKPWLTAKNLWSVPAWLLYGSGIMVFFLFFGLFILPETNFAIADFWRWMVVHMWVEVTFEVFTTVIVAYMMVQMKFIPRIMAERVIFLAVMMFLFTATIGVAHNFYWIAKPTGVIALGSVFSTLQVLPLLLLTIDAWQLRRKGQHAAYLKSEGRQNTAMEEVWLFILAVNFWNIFGAGVLGSLINLPIINYFEHATYLTNNHAHGAMFGVKGNIAIGGMLFCCQHLLPAARWNGKLVRVIFWSLNTGIALMMFLNLFPAGLYQLFAVFEHGFWYARSAEIVEGPVFKTLVTFRTLGGIVFVCGGVIPLIWFILSRRRDILPESDDTAYRDQGSAQKNWAQDRLFQD
jgi:nitric oxide reductase subunit B